MKRDQKILDAACRLFVERGYEPVSIDEIGRAAGVSGPAIYRHFGAKAEILATLCNQTIDRLIELVGPRRSEPGEELEALIRGQALLAANHPDLLRVYESEERSLPELWRKPMRRRQREHAERWVEALARLRPRASRADLEVAAFAAIGLLLSAPRWPRATRAHPELAERLMAAARRCVEAPARLGQPTDEEVSVR